MSKSPYPGTAIFSPCGRYRYMLTRTLVEDGTGYVNFILLNPSTADAEQDDPTIRRCIGFAQDWGYSSLVATNLFAYRATSPKDMKSQRDPVGPENDYHILNAHLAADQVILAWGNHGLHLRRAQAVIKQLSPLLYCLGTTRQGQPVHPLYQPRSAKPVIYGAKP